MPEKIGRYEDLQVIGRGGMGVIYKARDPVLERSVALKVISSVEITDDLRARFYREARACARLRDHPNIVTIHDMGEDAGRLFIVMELLEGEELRHLMARRAPLTLENKLAILRQICSGLYHAHQRGVVHRDIKPANIFLLPAGQVKILDFGIAQLAAATTHGDLTRGMMMGTPRYMAPEQVRGQADPRSDIFSVGAVAYELFSGRPPFTGENPMEILEQLRTATPPRLSVLDPDLPPALSDIVERAIQKEPEARFADLGEMGREVEAVRRGLGEGTQRVQVIEGRQPAREPASVVSSTAGVVEPPHTDHEEAESTDRWPSRGAATAWDTSEPVSRVPRVAIVTGVALAAVLVAAFYYWQASSPSGAVADKTAAPAAEVVKKVSEERPASTEISLPSATNAAKTEREIKTTATEVPVSPTPASSAPASTSPVSPAPVSPPASKADKPSPPAREKAATIARAPSGPREDAEQARLRMAEAKRAAERVAAEFFARKRFEAAQSKERDGMAALGKSDYATAIGLFTEARAEYQAAAQEAPSEEEKDRQQSVLRSTLDEAHAAVAARRQEALTAEADKVAREVFDQAQAKQVEGDRLVSRNNLIAAARAYKEAADRYAEATVRARAVRR